MHPPAFQKIAPTPPEKLGFDDLFCSNEADFKRVILVYDFFWKNSARMLVFLHFFKKNQNHTYSIAICGKKMSIRIFRLFVKI